MNKILKKLPQLIETKEDNILLEPIIYPTAWSKWAISYIEVLSGGRPIKRFTVVIEPDRDPVRIEDTIGTINDYIGNAPSFEEAVIMIVNYIKENYNII